MRRVLVWGLAAFLPGCAGSPMPGSAEDGGVIDGAGTVDAGPLDSPDGGGVPPYTPVDTVSYFGGSSSTEVVGDMGRDSAVDDAGNWYVTGGIDRFTNGVFVGASGRKIGPLGDEDVFVLCFAPDGSLRYATAIGGSGYDRAYAIEIDPEGHAVVVGRASDTFPTTADALQPTFAGDDDPNGAYGANDGFIFELGPDGALLYSTYFGSGGRDFIRDLDLDAAGNLYVAVSAIKGTHPFIAAGSGSFEDAQPTSDYNNALLKLDPTAKPVLWGGYLGGTGDELSPPSVQVTRGGDAFVLWASNATDLPISATAFQTDLAGQSDMVLARVTVDGSAFVYMTYLGTSGFEFMETHQVAVNDDAEAAVMFQVSADFPVPAGAFQTARAAGPDLVIAKVSPDGTSLVAATYLGGDGVETGEGLAMDASGRVALTGHTDSSDFPTTSNALSSDLQGGHDAIAVILSADLTALDFSTLVGGGGDDGGRGVSFGPLGEITVAGQTTSTNLPVVNAIQGTSGMGRTEVFLMHLAPRPAPASPQR